MVAACINPPIFVGEAVDEHTRVLFSRADTIDTTAVHLRLLGWALS
jgi:hypothetical protein